MDDISILTITTFTTTDTTANSYAVFDKDMDDFIEQERQEQSELGYHIRERESWDDRVFQLEGDSENYKVYDFRSLADILLTPNQ